MQITNTILPLFPLSVVILPKQSITLHIFEPRYKQLIRDCLEFDSAFGIPFVYKSLLRLYGTVVKIKEITKEYPSGEMDIVIEGESVFQLKEAMDKMPQKLYNGALVQIYPQIELPMDLFFKEQFKRFANSKKNGLDHIDEIEIASTYFDAARLMQLSEVEKYLLLSNHSVDQKIALLKNKMKYHLLIQKQLEQVQDKLHLN